VPHKVTVSDSKNPPPGAEASQDTARAPEIARLFREHNRALVLYLAARLKDVQAAHEVAQEAYVRLLQLELPGTVSFMRAYLFKVAGNLAIDRIRQRQTRARCERFDELDNLLTEPSVERTLIARDELAHLGQLITELPDKYQQAFRLHLLDDGSFEDIAQHMGIKERMVRRYVTNTLLYLRLRREGLSSAASWRQVQS
jgi:RNA polymerase sigma factor (sigma-70 family)